MSREFPLPVDASLDASGWGHLGRNVGTELHAEM